MFTWSKDYLSGDNEDPSTFNTLGVWRTSWMYLEDANKYLPQHYEWISEWKLDVTYTKQDTEGWSYGSSFDRIISKFESNQSNGQPDFTHFARRRLWTRLYRKNEPLVAENREEIDASTIQRLLLVRICILFVIISELYIMQSNEIAVPFIDAEILKSLISPKIIPVIVCENQRYDIKSGWSADNLISASDWGPFTNPTGSVRIVDFADNIVCPTGFMWVDDWQITKRINLTDANGFAYYSTFQEPLTRVNLKNRNFETALMDGSNLPSGVRQRIWVRNFANKFLENTSSTIYQLFLHIDCLKNTYRLGENINVIKIELNNKVVAVMSPIVSEKIDYRIKLPITCKHIRLIVKFCCIKGKEELVIGQFQNDSLIENKVCQKSNW